MKFLFDPDSPEFWSQESAERELRRVFEICDGCRRCFNLCPSFSVLLGRIDDRDGDVGALTRQEHREVVDLCYQCKLCFNHCPYTPPHEFAIDFPRLMLRAKAVRARQDGVTRQDRILAQTDRLGRLGTALAPVTNWANRMPAVRGVMEGLIGIHRDRRLPCYAGEPFVRWFARRGPRTDGAPAARAALFCTCSVNYNCPPVGQAAVEVLEHNRVAVTCPEQRCCGMPALDGGDLPGAIEAAAYNVEHLAEAIRAGAQRIVVPGPTCSYVLKQEYPLLLKTEDARLVAEHTADLCEYLMQLREQGLLDTAFPNRVGKVAYQIPCHLRAQNIGFKSRDLMRLIPGTEVVLIERCSGMDGTWGMKKPYFELSLKVARPLLREIDEAGAELVVTDCPLSGLQIEQGTGRRPLHPIEVVKRAYGL
ncbi:MAG: ferredoxin [Deltaproteobacteria bacterium]|nr:ferredoxin [Deltaproteobacteria bacterium]